jgi:hypothetical protein
MHGTVLLELVMYIDAAFISVRVTVNKIAETVVINNRVRYEENTMQFENHELL